MGTFYLLYVLFGGGIGPHSWGGPALLRFDGPTAQQECNSAAEAMKDQRYLLLAKCVRVDPR